MDAELAPVRKPGAFSSLYNQGAENAPRRKLGATGDEGQGASTADPSEQAGLEESCSPQAIVGLDQLGGRDWIGRLLDHRLDGRFDFLGTTYHLRPTSPVSCTWPDGTVMTMTSWDGRTLAWATAGPDRREICWDLPAEAAASSDRVSAGAVAAASCSGGTGGSDAVPLLNLSGVEKAVTSSSRSRIARTGSSYGEVLDVLRQAKPDWSESALVDVEGKLAEIGISWLEDLAEALKGPLNARLRHAGFKAFKPDTVRDLRAAIRTRLLDRAGEVLAVLKEARPGWSEWAIVDAETKLAEVHVFTLQDLAEALRGPLNGRLRRAGFKAFKPDTIRDLSRIASARLLEQRQRRIASEARATEWISLNNELPSIEGFINQVDLDGDYDADWSQLLGASGQRPREEEAGSEHVCSDSESYTREGLINQVDIDEDYEADWSRRKAPDGGGEAGACQEPEPQPCSTPASSVQEAGDDRAAAGQEAEPQGSHKRVTGFGAWLEAHGRSSSSSSSMMEASTPMRPQQQPHDGGSSRTTMASKPIPSLDEASTPLRPSSTTMASKPIPALDELLRCLDEEDFRETQGMAAAPPPKETQRPVAASTRKEKEPRGTELQLDVD